MAPRVVDDVVFVTGASSGIGAGMAARFHARGVRVIISGRDRARLESVAFGHPGMSVVVMDVANPDSVARGIAEVAAHAPHLTTLVNNAGIQRLLDFSAAEPPGPSDVAPEIATNLTGLINVTAAALPLLRRAPRSRLVHVGSGLGFVPYAKAPVYSATKAAVHSFTVSLRRQLVGPTVQVVEMIVPVVDTPLHRDLPSTPPMAMPLERFLDRAMSGLDAGRDEIPIGLGRMSQIGGAGSPEAPVLADQPRRLNFRWHRGTHAHATVLTCGWGEVMASVGHPRRRRRRSRTRT